MTLPVITNPAALPGAFLFLTVKGTPDGDVAVVAYDPEIKKGTKLKHLKVKYVSALPYMQRFSKYTSTNEKIWEGQRRVSYGGIFGGPDPTDGSPKKRSPLSSPWPFTDPQSPIVGGVYISYWWIPNGGGTGMHTSHIRAMFEKGSEVEYMDLFPGNSKSLITENSILGDKAKSITIDWYATFAGDLGWSKESI